MSEDFSKEVEDFISKKGWDPTLWSPDMTAGREFLSFLSRTTYGCGHRDVTRFHLVEEFGSTILFFTKGNLVCPECQKTRILRSSVRCCECGKLITPGCRVGITNERAYLQQYGILPKGTHTVDCEYGMAPSLLVCWRCADLVLGRWTHKGFEELDRFT